MKYNDCWLTLSAEEISRYGWVQVNMDIELGHQCPNSDSQDCSINRITIEMIKRYSILGVAFLFVAPVAIAQDLSTLEQKLDSLLKINVELVAQFRKFSTEAIGQLNDTTSTVEQESTRTSQKG